MISVEVLRRYPHFANVGDACLAEVAKLCEEREFKSGDRIFEESGSFMAKARIYEKGAEATHLMLLTEGTVDVTLDSRIRAICHRGLVCPGRSDGTLGLNPALPSVRHRDCKGRG